jgi:aspartyl/asparaginyl beta-hydroxylase (cupin superfamily)
MNTLPNFYDPYKTFPFIEELLSHYKTIYNEMKSAKEWYDWPEENLYDKNNGHKWKVLPFCYTFPANDESKIKWVDSSKSICPKTVAILKEIPGIRTALFSRMGPNTILVPHQGWADLSNHVLRIHFPLYVPDENDNPCGVVVDNEIQYHKTKKFIVFDDSKSHYAFNKHNTKSRYVLIFDIIRPDGFAKGISKIDMTKNLDSFIDYFN